MKKLLLLFLSLLTSASAQSLKLSPWTTTQNPAAARLGLSVPSVAEMETAAYGPATNHVIRSSGAGQIPLKVYSNDDDYIQQWVDSAGNVLASVDAFGAIYSWQFDGSFIGNGSGLTGVNDSRFATIGDTITATLGLSVPSLTVGTGEDAFTFVMSDGVIGDGLGDWKLNKVISNVQMGYMTPTDVAIGNVPSGFASFVPDPIDGGYPDTGQASVFYRVYAYKTAGAHKVFSATPLLMSADFPDVGDPGLITATWTAVPGASGYRVVVVQDVDAFVENTADAFFDTTANTFEVGFLPGGPGTFDDQTTYDYGYYGSTVPVTPSSPATVDVYTHQTLSGDISGATNVTSLGTTGPGLLAQSAKVELTNFVQSVAFTTTIVENFFGGDAVNGRVGENNWPVYGVGGMITHRGLGDHPGVALIKTTAAAGNVYGFGQGYDAALGGTIYSAPMSLGGDWKLTVVFKVSDGLLADTIADLNHRIGLVNHGATYTTVSSGEFNNGLYMRIRSSTDGGTIKFVYRPYGGGAEVVGTSTAALDNLWKTLVISKVGVTTSFSINGETPYTVDAYSPYQGGLMVLAGTEANASKALIIDKIILSVQ